MNNSNWLLKAFKTVGLILTLGVSMTSCADTLSWQEEVKLLDGRVIVVEQKRRYERAYTGQDFGNIPREAWVTFKLPEFGNQYIVWHESLDTQVLNVFEGKLYIVGFPHTEREYRQYGSPKPSYVGYRYDNGHWTRLAFNEIPVAIYDSNMWFENEPPKGAKSISLEDKSRLMKNVRYSKSLKKIDPNSDTH